MAPVFSIVVSKSNQLFFNRTVPRTIAIVSLGANRDQTIVIEDPIHGPKRALLNS